MNKFSLLAIVMFLITLSSISATQIGTDNLLFIYTYDNVSGQTYFSSWNGTYTQTGVNTVISPGGINGSYAVCTDTNDQVKSTQTFSYGDAFTISVWINADSWNDGACEVVFDHNIGANEKIHWGANCIADADLEMAVRGSGWTYNEDPDKTTNIGKWTNYVQRVNNSVLYLFKDGVLVDTDAYDGTAIGDEVDYWCIPKSGGTPADINIDEQYSWARALSNDEIIQLNNSFFDMKTKSFPSDENQPPGGVTTWFFPITVSDRDNQQTVMFNWTASTDPEGDNLTYEFFINGSSQGTTINTNWTYTFSQEETVLYRVDTTDTSNNSVEGDNRTLTFDETLPIITNVYPSALNNTIHKNNTLIYQANYDDNGNIWGYNVSLFYFNGSNVNFENRSNLTPIQSYDANITFDLTGLPDGTYFINQIVSDPHTKKEWTAKNKGSDINTRKLFVKNKNDDFIDLYTDKIVMKRNNQEYDVTNSFNDYLIIEESDRISYVLSVTSSNVLKGDEYVFYHTVWHAKGIQVVEGSDYPAHLILGDTNWMDFNHDGLINYEIIRETPNQVQVIITSSNPTPHYQSIGGLNFVDETISFVKNLPANVSDLKYYFLNSSQQIIGNETIMNTANLTQIEFLMVNFTVTDSSNITGVSFFYTANGTNGCALGNRQSNTCFIYPDFVKFTNNTLETYFDGTQGTRGDFITCNYDGDSTIRYYSCLIDEHYNPNVFKWYNAEYDFSDVKWQNGNQQRIRGNQMIKVEINQNIVPLDADQYKLDIRVNSTISPPNEPLEAYACNSSYVSGDPEDTTTCAIIATVEQVDFQDEGTKFRAIFTKQLIDELGDLKWILFENHDASNSKYYFIKTYAITNGGHTQKWEYSVNSGGTWNNLGDGYETEMNINWFYDGINRTNLVWKAEISDALNDVVNTSTTSIGWDINPSQNYPPIVSISNPADNGETIRPFNFTWIAVDPNDDPLNVTLFINGTVNVTSMTELNSSLLLNPSDGDYVFTIQACETNTTDLFCTNDTHTVEVSLDDFPPIIASVTITPTNPLIVDTIFGKAKATDVNDDNVSYEFKWYNNSVLYKSVVLQAGSGFCYQEFVNVSTDCGGLGNQSYNSSPWNGTAAFDGNYSTYMSIINTGGFNKIYIVEYTKVAYTTYPNTSLLWQVKYGDNKGTITTNITVNNENCLSQNVISLKANFIDGGIAIPPAVATDFITFSCWNGINYSTLLEANKTFNADVRFYEEGVFWQEPVWYPQNVEQTLDEISSSLMKNPNEWILSSRAVDRMFFSQWINSSISTVGLPIIRQCNDTINNEILTINYFDQLTENSINATTGYNLKVTDGIYWYNQTGVFSINNSHSFCSDLNPATYDFTWASYGDLTIQSADYITNLYTLPEAVPQLMKVDPTQVLNIYSIKSDNSSTLIYNWLTTEFQLITGTLFIRECLINGTKILAQSIPITDGKATGNVNLFFTPYSYQVLIGNTLYEQDQFSLCHIEPNGGAIATYYVDVGAVDITPQIGLYLAGCTIRKQNGNVVQMNWTANSNDASSITACMTAKRSTITGWNDFYTNCSTGTSGSFTRTIPGDLNNYLVTGLLTQQEISANCIEQVEFSQRTSASSSFGATGVFAAFLLVVSLGMLYAGNGEVQLLGAVFGIVSVWVLGLLSFGWATISAIIFFLLLVAFIGRYSRSGSV